MDWQKNAYLSPDSSEKCKVPGTAKPLNPHSARQRREGRGGEVRPSRRSWGTECFAHHTLHPKSPKVRGTCPPWSVLPFVCLPLKHNSFWRRLRRLQGEAVLNSLSQKTDCPQASGGRTARPLYPQSPHMASPSTDGKWVGKPSALRLWWSPQVNNAVWWVTQRLHCIRQGKSPLGDLKYRGGCVPVTCNATHFMWGAWTFSQFGTCWGS